MNIRFKTDNHLKGIQRFLIRCAFPLSQREGASFDHVELHLDNLTFHENNYTACYSEIVLTNY